MSRYTVRYCNTARLSAYFYFVPGTTYNVYYCVLCTLPHYPLSVYFISAMTSCRSILSKRSCKRAAGTPAGHPCFNLSDVGAALSKDGTESDSAACVCPDRGRLVLGGARWRSCNQPSNSVAGRATGASPPALLSGRIACDCTTGGNGIPLKARLPSAITVREVSLSRAVAPSVVDVVGRSIMFT